MSCRTTKGGTLSLRLAKHYSGLSDKRLQKLFHALAREGKNLPPPESYEIKEWANRQRALIRYSDFSAAVLERCEKDLFRAKIEEPNGGLFYAWSNIELRSRQESVLSNISNVVDLDPPGSQSQYYVLDKEGRPTVVWYASYGSNMNKQRFLTYIEGGQPEGSNTIQAGARDKTLPQEEIPIRFDGRMHFAYSSSRWGNGGVAFMDVDHAGHALGRAYQITAEQFDDVVAQENGKTPGVGKSQIDFDTVLSKTQDDINHGLYGTLIHIGDYKCAPVLTFTSNFTVQESIEENSKFFTNDPSSGFIASNNPTGNYLRMIHQGLQETFNLSDEEAADYIRGCAGAAGWTRRKLLEVLRAENPEPMPTYTPPKKNTYSSTPGLFPMTPKTPPSPASLASVGITTTNRNSPTPVFSENKTPQQKPKRAVGKYAYTCEMCGKSGHSYYSCHLYRESLDEPPLPPQEPKKSKKRDPKKRTSQKRKPKNANIKK